MISLRAARLPRKKRWRTPSISSVPPDTMMEPDISGQTWQTARMRYISIPMWKARTDIIRRMKRAIISCRIRLPQGISRTEILSIFISQNPARRRPKLRGASLKSLSLTDGISEPGIMRKICCPLFRKSWMMPIDPVLWR